MLSCEIERVVLQGTVREKELEYFKTRVSGVYFLPVKRVRTAR
jgi:hypothetical protein